MITQSSTTAPLQDCMSCDMRVSNIQVSPHRIVIQRGADSNPATTTSMWDTLGRPHEHSLARSSFLSVSSDLHCGVSRRCSHRSSVCESIWSDRFRFVGSHVPCRLALCFLGRITRDVPPFVARAIDDSKTMDYLSGSGRVARSGHRKSDELPRIRKPEAVRGLRGTSNSSFRARN